MNVERRTLFGAQWRPLLLVLVLVGAVALGVGLATDSVRAWSNLLAHNFYFLAISLMAVFFMAMQYLAKAGWPTVLRRVPEAMVAYLPIGAVLMLAFAALGHGVYHWAHAADVAQDPILQAKSPFLNVTGFVIRAAVFLALWLLLARVLVKTSRRQDETGDLELTKKSIRTSAVFVVLFGLTFSVASMEWIMSLEPHWYSTLFPWYVMSSMFVAALALITVLVILLKKAGFLPEVNAHHRHDLAKYVFSFSIFWGYLWFSQYMLIWYGNIPEETTYYLARQGDWSFLFWTNFAVNLFVPLLFLLPEKWKKNENHLLTVCLIVVAGHWLDTFLMVMPSHGALHLGWLEIGMGLGVAALFLLLVNAAFLRIPLLPKNDPYFEESLHHHHS